MLIMARFVWVTMLRDPIDRALSEWTHITQEVPREIGMWPRTGMVCKDPLSKDEGHLCILPKQLPSINGKIYSCDNYLTYTVCRNKEINLYKYIIVYGTINN